MVLPSATFDIYCDMDTDSGGWTVFYKRQDGSTSFPQSEFDYITMGVGSPSATEFLTPLSLIADMTSDGEEYSLLIEMRETKEKAFALYQGFKIDLSSTTSALIVEKFDASSSAGDSLTLASSLTSGCSDVSAASYSAGSSCHFVNLLGAYDSNTTGSGIHWGSWLGMGVSLDSIEMKFKKRQCQNTNAHDRCNNCKSGLELRIDEETGRLHCVLASSSNKCTNKVRRFSSDICITDTACDSESRQALLAHACFACDASCPLRCKGPSTEDCLFETCLEMQRHYPGLAGNSHFAVLYLKGELTKTWCHSGGWTQILLNQDLEDVSSLSFSNYEDDGFLSLPNQMLPLSTIQNIASSGGYELRVELSDSSGSDHFDSYTSFSLDSATYIITLGYKKASSASLAAFDLSTVLSGVQFEAQSSGCFAAHQVGSWYSPTCEGFALLGQQTTMFYGPLSGTITKAKLLIRETHCLTWTQVSAEYLCSQCESGYLPNALGECISCPAQALCDLSPCTDLSAFLSDNTQTATCLLDSYCDLDAVPAAGCSAMDPSSVPTSVTVAGTATQGAIASTAVSCIVYSLATGMPLDNLWTLINSMQLMSFLKFVNCSRLPSNFLAFLSYLDVTLGKVAFVDYLPNLLRLVIPLDFSQYKEKEQHRFMNPFINDSSFKQSSFLLNYEQKLLFFLYLSFPIFALLLARSLTKRHSKAYKILSKCTSCALFWRMSISVFMELAFLSLFSFSKASLTSGLDVLNLFFSLTSSLFLLLIPAIVLGCSLKHKHSLHQSPFPAWRGKFIYFTINLQKKTTVRLLQPVFFFLQRLFYALGLIYLSTLAYLQIAACFTIFTSMVIYLATVKPFKSKCLLFLSLLNESVLLSLVLFMALFQFFASRLSEQAMSTMGAIMIILLVLCFLTNISPLLFKIIAPLCKMLSRRCRRIKKKTSSQKYHQKTTRVHPESGTDFSVSFPLQNNFTSLKWPRRLTLKTTKDIDRIPSF